MIERMKNHYNEYRYAKCYKCRLLKDKHLLLERERKYT